MIYRLDPILGELLNYHGFWHRFLNVRGKPGIKIILGGWVRGQRWLKLALKPLPW